MVGMFISVIVKLDTYFLDQTTLSLTTTNVFLDDLRKSFPYTNFIGIRISEPREFGRYINKYGMKTDEEMKKIRKDKSYNHKSKYTHSLGIISNSLNNDTTFEVDEGAIQFQKSRKYLPNLLRISL